MTASGAHGTEPTWPSVPVDAVRHVVDLDSLGGVRDAVGRQADRCGLGAAARDDLVLAANELATNVVRHGGGSGRLRLWAAGGWFYCQISDRGPGLADTAVGSGARADVNSVTGRGLWLVRRLTHRVRIETGTGGTTITLAMALAMRSTS
jgi:anti-sigma regulatory factor (Ser/Thr protein kinase)